MFAPLGLSLSLSSFANVDSSVIVSLTVSRISSGNANNIPLQKPERGRINSTRNLRSVAIFQRQRGRFRFTVYVEIAIFRTGVKGRRGKRANWEICEAHPRISTMHLFIHSYARFFMYVMPGKCSILIVRRFPPCTFITS